jgi:hypothetical protein
MPVSSSTAPVGPERVLTTDDLRRLLADCGYDSTVVDGAKLAVPAGCSIDLQFGEDIALGDGETARAAVRCKLAIGANHQRAGRASRWHIHKLVALSGDVDRFCVAIEAELLLGEGLVFGGTLARETKAFDHLQLLLADARETLQAVPRIRRDDAQIDRPVLRIEARFVGELAAGRSGLVRSGPGGSAPRQISAVSQQLLSAACTCVADQLIPDLTRVLVELAARPPLNTRFVQPNARDHLPGSSPCQISSSPI